MKRIMTLVAAAMMAVGLHAQNEETIYVTSGNADWGQMTVDNATVGGAFCFCNFKC